MARKKNVENKSMKQKTSSTLKKERLREKRGQVSIFSLGEEESIKNDGEQTFS